jgi:CheY-like chemotaxis protein
MVDDQPAKLLSYEVILAELGENLIKATSGKEALEHLLKTDIAVVLMDVSMPDLDGFELAGLIRQHPRFQRTAIIFISAVHLTDRDARRPGAALSSVPTGGRSIVFARWAARRDASEKCLSDFFTPAIRNSLLVASLAAASGL